MARPAAKECLPRELEAIHYLMRGYTQKDALLAAGYSASVAKDNSHTVFQRPRVQKELKRRREKMAAKKRVSEEWVLERLMKIADASLGDLLEFDDEGKVRYNWDKLTPEMRYALTGMKTREYKEGRGPDATPVTEMKPEMADKLRALDMIAKYLGMFTEKVEVSVEEDLAKRLRAGFARTKQEDEDGSDV